MDFSAPTTSGSRDERSTTIITYHGVGQRPAGETTRMSSSFRRTRLRHRWRFLLGDRSVVSLQELVQGGSRGTKPTVAITFDDAYRERIGDGESDPREVRPAEHSFRADALDRRAERLDRPPTNLLEIMDAGPDPRSGTTGDRGGEPRARPHQLRERRIPRRSKPTL